MILSHFRAWVRTAPAAQRAQGADALARAYLYSRLGEGRAEAERILTELLDDPSPLVRRALAEALCDAADAPHHVVTALADDQAEIASLVLSRSPVLTDAELIDCAAVAGAHAQAAVAIRRGLSAPVAAALAEIGASSALVALAGNLTASLPSFSLRRMLERHGTCADLRESLLARHDLPGSVRIDLVAATVRALATFVTERNWISGERMARIAVETGERAAVTVACANRDGLAELVRHLRRSGKLTVGLALRAVLSGKLELFKAVLTELSGAPPIRVDAAVRRCGGPVFAGLYGKAGLPAELLPAFRAALIGERESDGSRSDLSRAAIERVLAACGTVENRDLGKLVVLLRRFGAEAARDEARAGGQHLARPLNVPGSLVPLEPLLLTEFDAEEFRSPVHRLVERLPSRRVAVTYTVDLAAIEAQLLAA